MAFQCVEMLDCGASCISGGETPCHSKSVEILWQDGTVFMVTDWSVNFTMICKKTSLRVDLVRKVIYKQQEE